MVDASIDIARAFYAAAAEKDATALAELLSTSFREDAAVEWPAGLPYGGRYEGTRVLSKVFAGLAAESAPLGPEGLKLVSLIDGGDQVAAQIEFDFRVGGKTIPSGAFELWTFVDGQVSECKAYYWDTAACVELIAAAGA